MNANKFTLSRVCKSYGLSLCTYSRFNAQHLLCPLGINLLCPILSTLVAINSIIGLEAHTLKPICTVISVHHMLLSHMFSELFIHFESRAWN